MGFAPRRPVNLNLNANLVARCESEVGNFSAHVEALLAADLEKRAAAAEAETQRVARAIDAFSTLYTAHGSLSEEMQRLWVGRGSSTCTGRPRGVRCGLSSPCCSRMVSRGCRPGSVAPLVRANAMPRLGSEHARVAPMLVVRGEGYVLNPFDLATLAVARLGEWVASFADDEEARRRIQDALDVVLKPF